MMNLAPCATPERTCWMLADSCEVPTVERSPASPQNCSRLFAGRVPWPSWCQPMTLLPCAVVAEAAADT